MPKNEDITNLRGRREEEGGGGGGRRRRGGGKPYSL